MVYVSVVAGNIVRLVFLIEIIAVNADVLAVISTTYAIAKLGFKYVCEFF